MAARRREAGPERAGDRRRLPARHDEDLHGLRAELGLRQRPRLPGRRATAFTPVGRGRRSRAARVARGPGRVVGRPDHAPLVRRERRRHGRRCGRFPDGCLPRHDARGGNDPPRARVCLAAALGVAEARRPGAGVRLVDLGLRPLPGSRREDGAASVPRVVRPPCGQRDAVRVDGRDARGKAGRVRASHEGLGPVQGVLPHGRRLAERERRLRAHARAGEVEGGRPRQCERTGCRDHGRRRALHDRRARGEARRRREAIRPRGRRRDEAAPAVRPAARSARDGPELSARPAELPVCERVDPARADRDRAR